MKFTDTHCHLDFDTFSQDLKQIILQCARADIHQIIVPAVHPDNWLKVIELSTIQSLNLTKDVSNQHCYIYPCLGIHPWFLSELNQEHLYDLSQLLLKYHRSIVAIGETGIDGVIAKEKNNLNQQKDFFDFQLQLAKQHQLPIVVHHRQSHQEILSLLKKANLNSAGVIHAFSGSYQQAKNYLDLGFKLGIGGTITYPRAQKTIDTIRRLPLASLLLETDAPSMPLFGYQGQNNSPLQLIQIFKSLVSIRTESAEEIAQQLEHNTNELFNLTQYNKRVKEIE